MYTGTAASDILIVGNSRGVNSFYQPALEEALQQRVFNLSYNGLRVDIARRLIEDYLAHQPAPRVLVLEASALTQAYPELLKDFKVFAPPGSAVATLFQREFPQQATFARLSHLYRYNSPMLLRAMYYWQRSDQGWINERNISDAQIAALANFKGTQLNTNTDLLADLAAIQTLCSERGIKLQVVLAPYYPAYAEKFNNIADWKARLDAVLDQPVRDYSRAVPAERIYYADWVHLNRAGGLQFLETLLTDNIFATR